MNTKLYGSLQGPVIPDSVDREHLPLGRQRLTLLRLINETKSKDQSSVSYTFLAVSADAGVRGTAFFRFNFRDVSLKFDGTIQYRDKGGVTKRLKADGTVEYYSKSLRAAVHENAFDETTASADVTSIYAKPVEVSDNLVAAAR